MSVKNEVSAVNWGHCEAGLFGIHCRSFCLGVRMLLSAKLRRGTSHRRALASVSGKT